MTDRLLKHCVEGNATDFKKEMGDILKEKLTDNLKTIEKEIYDKEEDR